ncbi:hypothetical protein MTO96_018182 [Rhipicephalus appendiculatus]
MLPAMMEAKKGECIIQLCSKVGSGNGLFSLVTGITGTEVADVVTAERLAADVGTAATEEASLVAADEPFSSVLRGASVSFCFFSDSSVLLGESVFSAISTSSLTSPVVEAATLGMSSSVCSFGSEGSCFTDGRGGGLSLSSAAFSSPSSCFSSFTTVASPLAEVASLATEESSLLLSSSSAM